MSSISIEQAKERYGDITEEETLLNMAKECSCYKIYKYAYGEKGKDLPHTEYKRIYSQMDETNLFNGEFCSNIVLVYDNGKTVNIGEKEKAESEKYKSIEILYNLERSSVDISQFSDVFFYVEESIAKKLLLALKITEKKWIIFYINLKKYKSQELKLFLLHLIKRTRFLCQKEEMYQEINI